MRIAVDTNLILRLLLADDLVQRDLAAREMDGADSVVLPTVALCEAAWVLHRRYGLPRSDIAAKLRALTEVPIAEFDHDEIEVGLAMLESGGDFADGVIARQGRLKGAEVLVTFDRKAVRRLMALGEPARLPIHDRP